MMLFRKKPVVVDAFVWGGRFDCEHDPRWFTDARIEGIVSRDTISDLLYIETLNGVVTMKPGDYVVRGVEGELYPCEHDIFEATYEKL